MELEPKQVTTRFRSRDCSLTMSLFSIHAENALKDYIVVPAADSLCCPSLYQELEAV